MARSSKEGTNNHKPASPLAEALPRFEDELSKMIQGAADAVTTSTMAGGLPFHQFVVTVQYDVKWEGSGSMNAAPS